MPRRQNRSGHDFLGDDADLRIKRKQRNSVERLQSLRGKHRIARRRFVEHILGRYKFVLAALVIPPLVGEKLNERPSQPASWDAVASS